MATVAFNGLPASLIRAALLVCACLVVSACLETRDNDPDIWLPPSTVKHSDGFEAVKAAADSGDPEAMYLMYRNGQFRSASEHGTLTNAQARQYLFDAATHKHYFAEGELHSLYLRGSPSLGIQRDLPNAIYWAQRLACDHTGKAPHMWLAFIYEGAREASHYYTRNYKEAGYYPELIGLLPKDPSMAYAHMELASVGILYNTSPGMKRLKHQMTDAEMVRAEEIVRTFREGGCPYDDLGKS